MRWVHRIGVSGLKWYGQEMGVAKEKVGEHGCGQRESGRSGLAMVRVEWPDQWIRLYV